MGLEDLGDGEGVPANGEGLGGGSWGRKGGLRRFGELWSSYRILVADFRSDGFRRWRWWCSRRRRGRWDWATGLVIELEAWSGNSCEA